MGDQARKSRECRIERVDRIETGAVASVQLSALALSLILLILRFICSRESTLQTRPKDGTAIEPVAIEIRGPADSSGVSLFIREPSLGGVLERAGLGSVGGSAAPNGLQAVIAHASAVELAGGVNMDSIFIYPMEPRKRLALGLKIDINHAGPDELAAVPGLSGRRADKIIRYRSEHGTIRQLEELLTKRVLGAETIRRIRPFVKCVL